VSRASQHRLEQFEQRIAALETAVRGEKGDLRQIK
jgi:hypothetical protein